MQVGFVNWMEDVVMIGKLQKTGGSPRKTHFWQVALATLLLLPMGGVIPNGGINLAVAGETNSQTSQTENQIQELARKITVRISSGNRGGSGVLIGKQSGLYTVLTNRHVLSPKASITVITPDGETVRATLVKSVSLEDLDAVLLQFPSSRNYELAKLGSLEAVTLDSTVFAAGFPFQTEEFTLSEGKLQLINPRPFRLGYQIGYENQIEKGMSGGPIVTADGIVIGINGIHSDSVTIIDNPFIYQDGTKPSELETDIFIRHSWGIPIQSIAGGAQQYLSLVSPRNFSPPSEERKFLVYEEVKQQAASFTVRLEMVSEGTRGSGVIIARQEDSYYVLTAAHVVEEISTFRELEVVTPDGVTYPAKNETVKLLRGADLAVVEFTSQQDYPVATIATHKSYKKGGFVFVGGFLGANLTQFSFAGGSLFQRDRGLVRQVQESRQLDNEYGLVYSNITAAGMSGGPVLDLRGHLIGIHGKAEGTSQVSLGSPEEEKRIHLGYSLGVPVEVFWGRTQETPVQRDWLQTYISELPPLTTVEIKEINNSFPSLVSPDSDDAYDWLNYGNQLWRRRAYAPALEVFDQALELEPNLYHAWYAKGQTFFAQEEYQRALAAYDMALKGSLAGNGEGKDRRFTASCWGGKGLSFNALEQYSAAVESFDRAISLNGKEFSFHLWRGLALENLGRYVDAVESYTLALEIAELSLGYKYRGDAYSSLQQYPEAIADYSRIIEINPEDPLPYNNRGNTYSKLENYEQAIEDYNRAIQLNPKDGDFYNNRGNAYSNLANYEEAIENYNRAIQLNPEDGDFYNNRGNAYGNLENYEQAIENYNRAIQLDSEYVLAYKNRGRTY